MIKKIKKWVNGLSVKGKLIVYGYATIAPVLIIICVGLFLRNYRVTTESWQANNMTSVESLAESINLLQSDIKDYTTYICINEKIRRLLVTEHPEWYNGDERLWQNEAPMEIVQDMISLRGEIKTIAIYPENGVRPYLRGMDGSVNLSSIEDVWQTEIYQQTVESATGTIWKTEKPGNGETYLASRTEKIVLHREIFDLSQQKTLGYIVIGVGKDKFYSLCENVVKNDEFVLVLDPNTGVLVSAGQVDENVQEYLLQEEFLQESYNQRKSQFSYGRYDIACKQLSKAGTIVCRAVPKKEWKKQMMTIVYTPVLLLLGLLVGLLPLLVIISNLVTTPLRKVSDAIRRFSKGDFNQQVEVVTEDEVGEVARCFNKMVGDIKKLINENYVIKLSEKESELAALQAQINPHFLYNTLDSLYWQATNAGNDDIAETILDLSQLFRLALNQGRNVVTVEQEMDLIRYYLQIQKMRFPRKLNYELNIAEEVKMALMPKLVLQPFVENAIVHGFESSGGPCLLTVDVRRQENMVHFEIRDTGAGMTKEQLASLWVSEPANYSKQRIGRYAIKNIRERLQLKYYDNFRLDIQSDVGKGTVVIMEIPYEEVEACQ